MVGFSRHSSYGIPWDGGARSFDEGFDGLDLTIDGALVFAGRGMDEHCFRGWYGNSLRCWRRTR